MIERSLSSPLAGLLLAAVVLFASSCTSAPEPEELDLEVPGDAGPPLTLGANDVLSVNVYGHPELSTPIAPGFLGKRVDPEGFLSLPLIGPVAVQGLTVRAAQERIQEAYAEYMQDPKVDVSVVEYSARRFYLYGEVNEPGPYTLDRGLNVYQALSMGGGFTSGADRDQIILLRQVAEEVEVHVIDGEGPVSAGLLPVRAGDFLFVRRSGSGRFRDEILPIVSGISSSLSTVATLLLIEDRLKD